MKERNGTARRALAVLSALAVTTIFLLTAVPSAAAQPPPFTYPVSAGVPVIPSSVGAQGTQGRIAGTPNGSTITSSQTGEVGKPGPSGVSPIALAKTPASFTVTVYYGTFNPLSASLASGVSVSLVNVTNGLNLTVVTGANGIAAFLSTYIGWYELKAYGSASDLNYMSLRHVGAGATTFTIYLLPTATAIKNIANGGATKDPAYITPQTGYSSGIVGPGLEVDLLNASSGNALLGRAYTLNNGTAVFTNVNTAFTYNVELQGFISTASGLQFYYTNSTGALGSPSGGTYHSTAPLIVAYTSYTATVTGVAPSVGASSSTNWGVTSNTVVNGGNLWLSTHIVIASGKKLTFNNTVVYWNDSGDNNINGGLAFVNSTVIFTSLTFFSYPNTPLNYLYLNDSMVFNSAIVEPANSYAIFYLTKTSRSEIWFPAPTPTGGGAGQSWIQGSMVNSTIEMNHAALAYPLETGWLNLTFVSVLNSSWTDTACGSGYGCGGRGGTYSDTWRWLYAVNDSLQGAGGSDGGPPPWTTGTFTITNSWFHNTSIVASVYDTEVTNSNLGLTQPSTGTYGFMGRYGNFTRTTWTESTLGGISFVAYYAGYSGHYQAAQLPMNGNLSNSVLEYSSAPRENYSLNTGFGSGRIQGTWTAYDDYIHAWYSDAQLAGWVNGTTGLPVSYGTFKLFVNGNLTLTYSTILSNSLELWSYQNTTLSHDLWPAVEVWDVYGAGVQMWEAPYPHYSVGTSYDFENDTFGTVRFNETLWSLATHFVILDFGYTGWPYLQDAGNAVGGSFKVAYDTFYAEPVGGGSGGTPVGLVQAVTGNVTGTVLHDLFWNAPSWNIGSTRVEPFGADVSVMFGFENVKNNYFLNLNRRTLPIQDDLKFGPTSLGGKLNLTANHYFYTDGIPPTAFGASQGAAPTDARTGSLNTSTIDYEIPVGKQAGFKSSPMGTVAENQLVFNTTITQTTPANSQTTSSAWSWSVAPDVNITTGAASVGYFWGTVAGPQPNFFWHGYNYSERVESAYVNIAVNSSNAPNVSVVLSNLIGGHSYTVVTYTALNAVLSTVTMVAAANGTIFATFAPATMGTNVTVDIGSDQSAVFFGLTVSSWSAISIILSIVALMLLLVAAERRYRD